MHLDHVTIRTRDPGRSRTFFETVFDLETGGRPEAVRRIPGWLYSGDEPIVHIIGANDTGGGHPAEAIDHVAFRLGGYDRFREKLERLSIPYSAMDLADIGERRLFIQAPGGPLLEGVFREAVPAEKAAEAMAA